LQALLSILLAIVDISIGGILVARGHLWHLAIATCTTLVIVVIGMQGVKLGSWGLRGVWWALVLYYTSRFVLNSSRLVASMIMEWRKDSSERREVHGSDFGRDAQGTVYRDAHSTVGQDAQRTVGAQ
jgi:hypothetical protein